MTYKLRKTIHYLYITAILSKSSLFICYIYNLLVAIFNYLPQSRAFAYSIHHDCSNCTIPHKEKFIKKNFSKDWFEIMKDVRVVNLKYFRTFLVV